MTFLVVTTESHRNLYEDFFLKTLPPDAVVLEKQLGRTGDGNYLSQSWQDGVTTKLRWALEYAEQHPGAIFTLSDVDIQFFPNFRCDALEAEFERSGVDVLFQREGPGEPCGEVNTGFYLARGTSYLTGLLKAAIRWCEGATCRNDQVAVNTVLKQADFGRRWGVLSTRCYARSQGFPPRRDIVLHHANCAGTTAGKIIQLRRVRRFVTGSAAQRWSAIAAEAAGSVFSARFGGMLCRGFRRMNGMTGPTGAKS